MEKVYDKTLDTILSPRKKQTPFEQQSISERMEVVRFLSHKTDKKIENKAFWAADAQRIGEKIAMKKAKDKVASHQVKLRNVSPKTV